MPEKQSWVRLVSRPVEVRAFQFDPNGVHAQKLPDRIRGLPSPGADNWGYVGCQFFVDTVLGPRDIQPLDWIIETSDGNWRVCSRGIFEQGFERV